ncbi:MAG: oxidoreductase, partial [Bacteroidales bacterium]
NDISILLKPINVEGRIISNRFVVQPMEGYDAAPDGSPSDLTIRRYLRYAGGGSGIIWFEAIAVMPEGRSNPRQLIINRENYVKYRQLMENMRSKAPLNIQPFVVAQLTHSGRYSKPDSISHPLVPCKNPLLDKGNEKILTDYGLKKIQEKFIEAAKLAREAGFDAIDIKACHGYLIHELLFSFQRKNSRYGGREPEKRFRFLLETIERIKEEVPGIKVTTRLNISDLYSGGFCTTPDGKNYNLSEALLLTGELEKRGIKILNTTMGSPYYNPHVVRPYDNPLPGAEPPEEHPLQGVIRMIEGISVIQHSYPGMMIIGSAYSWLRHFALNVGAAVVQSGGATFIGFGRNSFAYPSMPFDLMTKGYADTSKFCITCSGCTRLIKNFRPAGCVIHDREIYGAELKKLINKWKVK